MISRFVANSEKCRKYMFFEGSAQILMILHRGGYQNLLQYYMGGGLPNLLQYYNGGGVSRDPKFVLRNIWTASYQTIFQKIISFLRFPNKSDRNICTVKKHYMFCHLVGWLEHEISITMLFCTLYCEYQLS